MLKKPTKFYINAKKAGYKVKTFQSVIFKLFLLLIII